MARKDPAEEVIGSDMRIGTRGVMRALRVGKVAREREGAVLRAGGATCAVVCVLVAAWELASRTAWVNPIVLPPASDTLRTVWNLGQRAYLWQAIGTTIAETLAGYAIAVCAGWVLGTAISMWRPLRWGVYPVVIGFQNVPRVALAPLFAVWFGFGLESKIAMAATISFFPIVISIVVGIETVDPAAVMLLRSFGASRWILYRKLYFHWSLPVVFSGLKTAMTLAVIGAIVAEFVSGSTGIGVLIERFNFQLLLPEAFACIVILMLLGLSLYGLASVVDRWLVFWRGKA